MPASSNGVRQLQAKLLSAEKALESKRQQRDVIDAEFGALQAQVYALQDAYDLVKPKPRVRKAKAKPAQETL